VKILAIETSAVTGSAAILEDDVLRAFTYQNAGLTHSRTLMPMVEDMLKNCDMRLSDMDAFALAVGPGSFTGLRIGISTIKGIAMGLDKPCIGVSTLLAMANIVPDSGATICCVMDARAGQVYNAMFEKKDGRLVRLCEDRAVSIEYLKEELKKAKKDYILVGDGANMCYNLIKCDDIKVRLAEENCRFQNAYGVALAAKHEMQNKNAVTADMLVPVYLRLPQAERERILKQERDGK